MAPGTRSELTSLQEEDEQPTANTVVLNQHTTVLQEEERMSCLLQRMAKGEDSRWSTGRWTGGWKRKSHFCCFTFQGFFSFASPVHLIKRDNSHSKNREGGEGKEGKGGGGKQPLIRRVSSSSCCIQKEERSR